MPRLTSPQPNALGNLFPHHNYIISIHTRLLVKCSGSGVHYPLGLTAKYLRVFLFLSVAKARVKINSLNGACHQIMTSHCRRAAIVLRRAATVLLKFDWSET